MSSVLVVIFSAALLASGGLESGIHRGLSELQEISYIESLGNVVSGLSEVGDRWG